MDFKSTIIKLKPWHQKLLHIFGVILFYSLLFTVFFSPVLFSGRLLAPGDALNQTIPAFNWSFDLWNPYIFSGFPHFADPQVMMWYLPRIIFEYISFNAFVVSAYVLAGCFTYGYAYKLSRNIFASLFAGITYSMSGFFMAHLGHTMMIHAAAWLPLIIWGLEELRAKYSPRWFAITSIAVGLCILAGHPQIMVYALGLSGLYVLAFAWNDKKTEWRYVLFSGGALIVGIMLSFIQLLPSMELTSISARAEINFQTFIQFSLPLGQSIQLLFPYLFGGIPGQLYQYPYFGQWNLTELTGYIGWLPLILAGIFLFMKTKHARQKVFWFIIAVLAFLLTLGDATPLAKLMFHIPGYNLFRVPARHFMEFSLAISILSALGLKELLNSKISIKHSGILTISVLSIIALSMLLMFIYQDVLLHITSERGISSFSIVPWENPAVGIPIIIAMVSVLVIIWLNITNKKTLTSLLLLVTLVIDLASFGWFYEWKYFATAKEDVFNMRNSTTEIGHQRIMPLHGFRMCPMEIRPNTSQMAGLNSTSGYNPLLLQEYHQLAGVWTSGEFKHDVLQNNNRAVEILAVRNLYILNQADTFTAHSIKWGDSAISTILSNTERKSVMFNVPGVKADQIGIVSSLGHSTGLADMIEVAKIEVIYADNTIDTKSIYAGRDVSEWAYDRPDVLKIIQHERARIFGSFTVPADRYGKAFEGHRYIAFVDIAAHKPVEGVKVSWVGPDPASLALERMSLFNSKNGKSWPITHLNSTLADQSRWTYMGAPFEDMGIDAYENQRAMPRAWFVPKVISLKQEDILKTIHYSRLPCGKEFNPWELAMVEEGLEFDVTSNKDFDAFAQIISIENDRIEIQVSSSTPAFLVLSDVYYPGWVATINALPTKIFKTNYILRGVMVPQGGHIIKFEFKPKSFKYGALASGMSFMILMGLIIIRIKTFKYSRNLQIGGCNE